MNVQDIQLPWLTNFPNPRNVPYRLPMYHSEDYAPFPQELTDRICEHLWDDLVTLASCCRVCRAWYHAARRVFWDRETFVENRARLKDIAHVLLAKRNQPYFEQCNRLSIHDNRQEPFARTWPLLIPGHVLPRLSQVFLNGLDWSTAGPHRLFYDRLSFYTSVYGGPFVEIIGSHEM
ncbi:uncharacterized protein C8Q71DRAFT_383417 [Rhodofomes roseus]|uniref:F-box domain-containing protein n=1 Tax=Rhodofomes roseus TaxID=34475 RepID=A0ABQ8JZY3_9APHY|nr:uncharacterized protein C8Q71DRAFT_383417 [Rhodofomes roseus]KAH9829933.1 hypothetical protein C8Q71DRAFT_383417 [Rhodofomes roseus]